MAIFVSLFSKLVAEALNLFLDEVINIIPMNHRHYLSILKVLMEVFGRTPLIS